MKNDGHDLSQRFAAGERAIAFDLDGTLVDAKAAVVDAVARGLAQVYRRHGIDAQPDRQRIVDSMGLPPTDYFPSLLPAKLQELAPEVQAAATAEEVRALHAGEGRLFPGTLESLDALRQNGWQLALVSNAQGPYFRAALSALDLQSRFSFCACHDDLPGTGKDRLLIEALRQLGVEGRASVMVGDRRDDIAAGQAVGGITVGARWGFGVPEELAQADYRLNSLTELVELAVTLATY